MDDLSTIERIEDHITFGAGLIPFSALLVTVFFAFVFGLIRFQNVRAPYGPLSPFLYGGFTILGLLISYFLLRWIGTWTFAPTLHTRKSAVLAVSAYFLVTLLAVFVGYLIINPQPTAIERLGLPDVLVGATVASIYTAILSSTSLLQDVAELLGQSNRRKRCIQSWLAAHNDAAEANGFGHTHSEAYEKFIEESESLCEELQEAKTNEGERLRREFDTWFSSFCQQDSMVRQQAILTGQTDNDNLTKQHQTLTWIRQEVENIGVDEDG